MEAAAIPLVVTRRVVDDDLAAAWEGLAAQVGAVPFARPGWLLAWSDAAGVRLEALTAYDGSRLAALLPLVWERNRVRTPADWHTPWLEAVAADDTARRALTAALASLRLPRVTVDFVVEGEPTAALAAAALAEAGYRLSPRHRLESPYVPLDTTWQHYLEAVPARRRRELRRRARRLEEVGTVSFEVHDGMDRLPHLLDEAFAVEAAGWKGAAGTAVASDQAPAGFYRRMAAWAAERGWLRLAFLRLDGRPLAFDLALEAEGRHFLLKTGFDPAFTTSSPGLLLRLHMLERAFAAGLRTYEFCGAADPWKLEWAPATRAVLVIEAFAPTPAGAVARAVARFSRVARITTRHLGRRLR